MREKGEGGEGERGVGGGGGVEEAENIDLAGYETDWSLRYQLPGPKSQLTKEEQTI